MTSKDYQTQSNPTKPRFLNILRIVTACSSSSVMPLASMTPWAMSSTQFNQTQANPTKPKNTQPNSIKLKQLNSITQPKSIDQNQAKANPIKSNQTQSNLNKPNQTESNPTKSIQTQSIKSITTSHNITKASTALHNLTQPYITQHGRDCTQPDASLHSPKKYYQW